MFPNRRSVGGFIFGVVYGGSVINGVTAGVGYVTGNSDYSLDDTPRLVLALYWFSTILMGLFAGYVGRSVIPGVTASAVWAAFLLAAPRVFFLGAIPSFAVVLVTATMLFATGVIAAAGGRWVQVDAQDLEFGRVLGVSWKHWLWLWIPWQLVVANVVWLGTPRFVLIHEAPFAVGDIVKSLISACAAIFAGFMALRTLRADADLTGIQSALQFAGWFLIVPILVNIWRLYY